MNVFLRFGILLDMARIDLPFFNPREREVRAQKRAQKREDHRRLYTPLQPRNFSSWDWENTGFEKKIAAILEDKPELTSILESKHAEDPEKITLLLSPFNKIMFARLDNELWAIKLELPCSLTAASLLLKEHTQFIRRITRHKPMPGYMVLQAPKDIPLDKFADFIHQSNPSFNNSWFTFGDYISLDEAPIFLALDAQRMMELPDFISSQPRVARRVKLPIPTIQ